MPSLEVVIPTLDTEGVPVAAQSKIADADAAKEAGVKRPTPRPSEFGLPIAHCRFLE